MTPITNKIAIIVIYSPTYLPTLNKITPRHKKNRKWWLWPTVYLSIFFFSTSTMNFVNWNLYAFQRAEKKQKNSVW
jgi:hypothetical protein